MALVSELMSNDPFACTGETKLSEIAMLMQQHNCREISILDSLYEGRFLGIITFEDVWARQQIEGVDLTLINAEQCMTSMPVAVKTYSTLNECLHLMDIQGIDRMPVIEDSGKYCGVVSREDIIKSGALNDNYV